jgi:hypothetical protein
MTQIVPVEFADPGSLKHRFPCRLKSGGDTKDTRSSSELLAPEPQHAHGFLIELHMSGLSILRIRAFDGKKLTVEVHRAPTQLNDLAAAQSRIHG